MGKDAKFNYIVSEEDDGKPLKEIMRLRFEFSHRLRSKLKQQHLITVNGKDQQAWIPLKAGDVIGINFPDEASRFEAEDIPICPVYEDDDLLIVNKQPGYVVHPTKGQPCHTITNGLIKYMQDTGQNFKIRFVNRLDRDTSGLLIIAKNSHSQDTLAKQMKENHINKRYIAIVRGQTEEDRGTVDLPIGRPDPDRVERGVMPEGGYPSVTHYTTLERFPGPDGGYSMLELILETGRTHQIRVHMAAIGHPVAGDHLYGGLIGCEGAAYDHNEDVEDCNRDCCTCEKNLTPIRRQALHAFSLEFTHPVTGEDVYVKAPMPDDMREFLESIY